MAGMQVARTKLSDALVSHFARQIVGGSIQPGGTLPPEPVIADQFGVSKPIARESIQLLAALGLVMVQQGKRTVVLDEAKWDVLDFRVQEAFQLEGRGHELNSQLYEARIILETSSASLAAKRSTPAEVAGLLSLVAEMSAIASDSRDLGEFLSVDRAFHEQVAEASGNVVLHQVVQDVHRFLASAWSRSTITADELPYLAELHAAIADAIARGDGDGAAKAVDFHLTRAAEKDALRSATSLVAADTGDLRPDRDDAERQSLISATKPDHGPDGEPSRRDAPSYEAPYPVERYR
jgi:GntR family transcriptional regulator, sialic acid-inducible nan operon repressor